MDDRNDSAHPNGNIFFSKRPALDAKIAEVLRVVEEIELHSTRVIQRCYEALLVGKSDPEDREYPDASDQIREVLIHDNYLSRKDIGICLEFDVGTLLDHESIDQIRELHSVLVDTHGGS